LVKEMVASGYSKTETAKILGMLGVFVDLTFMMGG
jgi:hypothetical protein